MLDKIALQLHRVKKIKTEDIKTPKEMYVKDAKSRLNKQNAVNTPISTINDLLIAVRANEYLKLTWEHSPEQLKAIDAVVEAKFDKNSENFKIYNEALKHLV